MESMKLYYEGMETQEPRKCSCGNDDFVINKHRNHTGVYCSVCGRWLKWANKNERRLAREQWKEF